MKSLRKSIGKDTGGPPISMPIAALSKPSTAVVPPKKVIRALQGYRPQAPTELPFQKGDFFYVIREVNVNGAWYEAHNPLSGARGLVPRALFDEFAKNATTPRTFSSISNQQLPVAEPPVPKVKPRVYYAVVLHDFEAERTDELDARQGDAISVVAQSNREWFVAKPIGRLGRPGLIPVSFVEIRDPGSNQPVQDIEALLDSGALPKVEDWKRDMMTYKANSIALGVLDDNVPNNRYTQPEGMTSPPLPSATPAFASPANAYPSPSPSPLPPWQSPPVQQQYLPQQVYPTPPQPHPSVPPEPEEPPSPPYIEPASSSSNMPEGMLLHASVVSFHYEMDEYWFRIHATFQPYDPSGTTNYPPAKSLVLFRAYNDFYDFQVELLENFPKEAGREPPNPRVLPFMPGPQKDVDDSITASRQAELDEYLSKLCELQASEARHILEDVVVRRFLAPKPGDVETDIEPRVEEMDALDGYGYPEEGFAEEMSETLARMGIDPKAQEHSDGSDYGEEPPAPQMEAKYGSPTKSPRPMMAERDTNGGLSLQKQAYAQNHQRTSSHALPSRTGSPMPETSPKMAYQGYGGGGAGSYFPPGGAGAGARASQAESSRSGSSARGGAATPNPNTPPISAGNPQTAFVKIKIFDRVTDDLIAIRVHPRVTHGQLMEKVQARLGGNVLALKFKENATNEFVTLEDDRDLREWMDGTDRHVLYAD